MAQDSVLLPDPVYKQLVKASYFAATCSYSEQTYHVNMLCFIGSCLNLISGKSIAHGLEQNHPSL